MECKLFLFPFLVVKTRCHSLLVYIIFPSSTHRGSINLLSSGGLKPSGALPEHGFDGAFDVLLHSVFVFAPRPLHVSPSPFPSSSIKPSIKPSISIAAIPTTSSKLQFGPVLVHIWSHIRTLFVYMTLEALQTRIVHQC